MPSGYVPASLSSGSRGGALPFAVRGASHLAKRLAAVSYLSGALGLGYFLVWGAIHDALRRPDILVEIVGVTLAWLSLDAALVLHVRKRDVSLDHLTHLALLYFGLRCVLLSVFPVRLDTLAGFEPPRFTLTCVAVVCLPILVAMEPKRALLPCSLGAATQPLAVAIFSTAGPVAIWNSAINAVIAVMAGVLCARITFGLRGTIERAHHLGAYHLTRLIARTEVSEVWLARHRLLARPAAVKRICIPHVGDAVLSRFVREAQATSLLTSPHTVTLYDYGVSEGGAPYYAMELLEGADLQSYVQKQGPLSAGEVVEIALQVCDSLEEAHDKGLLHRDLKPSNVFRCRSGLRDDFVKVLDFGLAEFRRPSGVPTGSVLGSVRVVGTPAYVVPELVLGRRVDERADIYQLGCTLFYLLTGRPVFVRRTVEMTCMAHVVDPAPPVSEHTRQDVPEDLVELVARCLEKNPADRPCSAAEVRRLLEPLRARMRIAREKALSRTSRAELERARSSIPASEVPGFSKSDEPMAVSLLVGGAELRGERAELVRRRLAMLVEIVALVTIVFYALWAFGNARGSEHLLKVVVGATAVSVLVDVVVLALAKSERVATRVLVWLALAYLVVRSFLVSYISVRLNLLVGVEPPRITFACVALSVIPLLVPTRPRDIAAPLLLAGATLPLSLVLSGVSRGVADSALNAAVAVAIGCYVASVSDRLRQSANRAGRLGSYHLVRRIGRGAMGEVWSAEHQLLARPAAIKLMSSASDLTASKTLMRRFEREAQVTATLTSPHAVRVFDYGMSNEGALYFVMELLDGRDLGRIVREDGPRSPAETVRIALEVCDALGEAHALGLVHRDLKPENLMSARIGLSEDFTKVLDFGIVELRRRLELTSQKGALASAPVAGTPGFMAPEMITTSGADGRADLYQLGCVMFFLLTGKPVFDEATPVATAMAHVTAPPPRVADALGRPIPEELESIVARCLAKDPAARFASAERLAAALRRVPLPSIVETERRLYLH